MSRNVWVFAILCILVAGSALASGVEVTPTVGYRYGGDFGHLTLNGTSGELSLDDTEEYGVIVSFPVTHSVDVEFRWSHEGADVTSTFGSAAAPSKMVADTYLGGVVYFFPVDSKVIRPFINFEIGTTNFDPNNGFGTDAGFAYAAGGGVKFYFGDHFGVRAQGSYLTTNFPGGQDSFCSTEACFSGSSGNAVGQLELTTGFIFRF